MTVRREGRRRIESETQASPVPGSAIVPLATAAALSAWLLSRGFPSELTIAGLLLLLIVFSTLLFRSALIPAGMFLTQLVLTVTERSSLHDRVDLWDQVTACSLLVLLLSTQRYLLLPEPAALTQWRQQLAETLRVPRWLRLSRRSPSTDQIAWRRSPHVSEFLQMAIRVALAVVVATWLLGLVPNNLRAADDVGLIPTAQRAIRLSLGFAVVTIVFNTLINAAAWRRLPLRAARLFLRAELSDWCGSEVRSILRVEEKHKRRHR
ncbi:hypothetical protein GC176_11350 [bacterium]|nr:hypothetical protein [bacterium]